MSKNVSTVSGIPKSANNLKKNDDIGKIIDQSTIKIEGSFIFEKEYTNGILNFDTPTLTTSSTSILSNFSTSFKFRAIVRKNFSNYNFFCFRKQTIFLSNELYSSSVRANSDSILKCWITIL